MRVLRESTIKASGKLHELVKGTEFEESLKSAMEYGYSYNRWSITESWFKEGDSARDFTEYVYATIYSGDDGSSISKNSKVDKAAASLRKKIDGWVREIAEYDGIDIDNPEDDDYDAIVETFAIYSIGLFADATIYSDGKIECEVYLQIGDEGEYYSNEKISIATARFKVTDFEGDEAKSVLKKIKSFFEKNL